MTLITLFKFIAQYVADVTPEEIARCYPVSHDGHKFFAVENERGQRNQDGEVIEYTVKYDEHGYTCSCPNGAIGFRVRHPSGVCKHVRWVVACELEMQAYNKELAAKYAQTNEPQEQDHHTSYFPQAQRTRAALELDAAGNEVSDAEYRTRVLAPTEESKRPFPADWLERR